jgi:hypothetical protein
MKEQVRIWNWTTNYTCHKSTHVFIHIILNLEEKCSTHKCIFPKRNLHVILYITFCGFESRLVGNNKMNYLRGIFSKCAWNVNGMLLVVVYIIDVNGHTY